MYKLTFEVVAYDISNILTFPNPDSLTNLLYSLDNTNVWIQTIGSLKHGDQFTATGEQAVYLKKLYVDISSPTLKIIKHEISATNLDAAESYTEDTTLDLIDIVITDEDSDNVTITLTLSNTNAGTLSTGSSGTAISNYDADNGIWLATGKVSEVNELLADLVFIPASNFNNDFTIDVRIIDGYNNAITGEKEFTGIAVNDAPFATNLSAPETYTQNVDLNLTNIVITDIDSVVTATLTLSTSAAGSLNTGTAGAVTSTFSSGIWTAAGAVSDVNTLLAGLTFTPASGYHSNFTISTSVNDGTTTISGTKNMTGIAVNSAPILDASKSPTLASIARDSGSPVGGVGTQIASLVDRVVPAGGLDNVVDVDFDTIGVAITAADSSNGSWFYSINSGTTWSSLGAVSDSSSRLLSSSSRLYFQPAPSFNGTISSAITFRAWDQTTGTNGTTVNTSVNGGTTAFSSATDTASITIT